MKLKLFNTLTRRKEEFIPISKDEVKVYSCGPTVYNYMHIGNLRTFFFEDILVRVLMYDGYNIKYVMNITDIGHLVSDSDEGEDKMEQSAKQSGKDIKEIAGYYTDVFMKDMELLNIIPPAFYPKATEYIKEQIEMIKCLEEKGFTYVTSDGVYYDTSKFPDYGKMAKLDIKGLQEGARIEFSEEKKNITDFALWKFSPKNEKRLAEWESPWGTGFPGWHIECSAMSKSILGNHLDIHCGGIDHIPVHHTNEIAQSEACNGEKFVNYWLHGEFLDMGNEKMSKSLGNFITLQTLIDRGFSPMEYRYFLLMAHYRKKLKFSIEALDSAASGYKNLSQRILKLKSEAGSKSETQSNVLEEYRNNFSDKINDDLNMPEAMAVIWDLLKEDRISSADKLDLIFKFDEVTGLRLNDIREEETEIPDDIQLLVRQRNDAKKNKNFKLADEIRNLIREKGYEIADTKEGSSLKKI